MAAPHSTAAIFALGDLPLERGGRLAGAELGYATWGELAPDGSNVVLLPGWFTGTTASYRPWIGPGFADPARWFVVATDLFGSGASTVPPPNQVVTVADNVRAQRALLDHLGVRRLRLVAGWSMGALQAYEWALRFPDDVGALLAICGGARCSPYNAAFLGGLRAVLADGGRDRLRAFGQVYAGWAYAPAYFTAPMLDETDVDDVLTRWGEDHVGMDADGLLAMVQTWQHADPMRGRDQDIEAVLGTIRCPTIVVAADTDRYFSLDQNAAEVAAVPGAQLRVLESELGHIAGRPGVREAESAVVARAFTDLLEVTEPSAGVGVDQLAGTVLSRRLYADAQGEDRDTRVTWLQGRRLHVDLRIGADPEDAGSRGRIEGFAGTTTTGTDGVTAWHRLVDVAPTGQADRGRLVRQPDGLVVEHGAEADYLEEWLPTPAPIRLELLLREGDRVGVLLRLGDRFGYAVSAGPASERGKATDLVCLGTVGPGGWLVEEASDPEWVGAVLTVTLAGGRTYVARRAGGVNWTVRQEWW